jgi:hypothetical protein
MQHCLFSGFTKIKHRKCYRDAKVQAGSSTAILNPAVHFGSRPAARVAVRDMDNISPELHPAKGMSTWWVLPPSIAIKDSENYPASVLGRDGSL